MHPKSHRAGPMVPPELARPLRVLAAGPADDGGEPGIWFGPPARPPAAIQLLACLPSCQPWEREDGNADS